MPGVRFPVGAIAPIAAGAAGAVIALGGAALLGAFEEPEPAGFDTAVSSGTPAVFSRTGGALSINQIYLRSKAGVVQISTRRAAAEATSLSPEEPFGFSLPEPDTRRGAGSGFVLDKSGHIVTNYHVVEGATTVEVSFSNEESMRARVVGVDRSTDLAVLKVNASSRALHPLRLGDSDSVAVGDAVVAIGNPLGYERTVTDGIVSALRRLIEAPDSAPIDGVIQTDAAINRGNSGGPLISTTGAVIGVNTQIATEGGSGGGNIGIGFAVPVNTVRNVAAQLIERGHVEHALLGVGVQPLEDRIARLFRLPVRRGLVVATVEPGTGAAKAGLRAGRSKVVVDGESWPRGGDVILGADGRRLSSVEQLAALIARRQPGDTMTLEVLRAGETRKIEVELGRRAG